MYEYDEETILPMHYPSHVLPLAVIRLFRTRNRLVRPLKYKREKDLANSKNVQRLNNETKPLKHLPRAAPYKKYVVEGRRSGTKLISDVPIEPPSDKPPTETTRKLEKFRRTSVICGGTGLGHLFYKRPFNKMPISWQRKFGFHSKRRSRQKMNTRKTEKRRSRSSSKESKKRKKSISRSPTPPPASRDKNLFEIFDKSLLNQEDFSNETSSFNPGKPNGHILRQQTDLTVDHYMTSVSSVDTGCNETGNRTIFGSHTPTQDERYCKDIDSLSSNSELGMNSGSNNKHTSETPQMCMELKNSSRRPDDNHWMRSNEFSSCFTPESATSTHELPKKETIKEVSASSNVNSSSGLQHTPVGPIYQLVRITIDEPDTQSIYHELRGIKLPTCDKKTIKDPRILRAMGCIIESPVMAGFGPFLRRIKNEPPDDPSYETKPKNILPLESIKKEPEESGENEDDVEKVLKELDDAIKAIQHKKDEVGSTTEDKNDNESTKDCKDDKTVDDTKAKQQSTTEDDKIREDSNDDFLPRNKGFSSYLPEYSKDSDYERTKRLLTEVFGDKALSPTKKVPMSMSDYFGSSKPNVSINSTTETNIEHRLSDIRSDSQLIHTTQITKKSPEKEIDHISKAKNSTETQSPVITPENKKKEKHNEKITSSSSGVSRPSKPDNENANRPIKIKSEPKSVRETSKERSSSKSLHSSHKTRSRSRSHSQSKTDKRKSKKSKKRSFKSESSSKTGRDRTRSNSPCAKKKKHEKHKSESSQSLEKKRSRSRSQSHISRERKRSGSLSSQGRSWSNSSNGSKTRQKHKLCSSVIKVSNGSKSRRKSRADEIIARENSPGRLQYLEQRRKLDTSKRILTKAKRYQEEEIVRRYNSEIETDIHYQSVFDKTRLDLDDTMNTFGDHMGSYTDITENTGFSDNRAATTSDETVVNSTLSKAMTSLLKKIVFRDNCNEDDSAEGRMADMVIELVKDQMSKELKPDVPTTGPSTSTGQCQSVHPFVPYLTQERSMDELYSSNPWNATASNSKNDVPFNRNEYYDDYMEQTYQNEGPIDDRSALPSFHARGPAYPPRFLSSISRQEHYGESHRSSYRGKLYSYKMPEKTRGSSYRGRITSKRGSFHPRGRRGKSRSRARGHPSYSDSSHNRYTKDKNNYEKK